MNFKKIIKKNFLNLFVPWPGFKPTAFTCYVCSTMGFNFNVFIFFIFFIKEILIITLIDSNK